MEISDAVKKVSSDLVVEVNSKTPRRGSFELTVVNESGKETSLWSGIEKGPPRRLKFPEAEIVVEAFKAACCAS
jgi:hypothetical protein